MDKEAREMLGGIIGIPIGGLAGLWLMSWLFHLGPDVDKVWWSIAYYMTALVIALVAWLGSATLIYLAVQQLPLSAGAEPK